MDSLVNQLAREMTDAIAAAVASDPKVEACREKARAAGADGYVAKPYSPRALLAKIREYVP